VAVAVIVGLGSESAKRGCGSPGVAVRAEKEGTGSAVLGGKVGWAEERMTKNQVGTEA
jgi:hypothetical protein